MNSKTLIEEFLMKGGVVEKLPAGASPKYSNIGTTTKKILNLKTLPEAELLYCKKRVKKKNKKKIDTSNINLDLIPDYLKKLIGLGD